MASSISSASFRFPTFEGTQDQAKARVKKMRQGLARENFTGQGERSNFISLERIDRSGTQSSFKIVSFSQPEERRLQTASYINSLVDKLYPRPTETQKIIKEAFAAYLNGTVEREGEVKNHGDISGMRLLDYLNDLHLAHLDAEAIEAGSRSEALPFSEDQPRKIETSLSDFLRSKEVFLGAPLGEGHYGIVRSARVKGDAGKYVYKIEKREVSKSLTERSASFWREGDCAAARLNDLSHLPRPLFFIFRISKGDENEELHYVPANHVKAFGMKLPPGTTVFLEGQLMEKATGESLDRIILGKSSILSPISGTHFKNIVRGLFKIVQELQTHNLVHRDIKPENIFYNVQTGEVQLLDFGSATKLRKKEKADDGTHLHKPISTEAGGTLKYISPRVLQQKPYGSEIDLFSFAMTVLQLVNKDDFEVYGRARFPEINQGNRRDALFATCRPTEYLDQFLESISDKEPDRKSVSLPAQSSFISGIFGWSGSDDSKPLNKRPRAQSMRSSVSLGKSKTEQRLERYPAVREIIDFAFQASGGGEEGAAAYEKLKNLSYFEGETSPATSDSPMVRF